MNNTSVKIGLFGAGYFGSLHAKNLIQTPFEFIGFFDPDDTNAKIFQEKFQIKRFTDPDDLIQAADAIDIVSPTVNHIEIANKAIVLNKHLFIEKPLASSSLEASSLIERSKGTTSVIQVGHIERFNPAFEAVFDICVDPRHIQTKRLAPYNPRANDISVVHDLMIHDIDAVLSVVDSKVDRILASGTRSITDHLDICEARLEFENGCIANLLASRMHVEQLRLMEVQCPDQLLQIDFLNKTCHQYSIGKELQDSAGNVFNWETPKGNIIVHENILNFSSSNAILDELVEFYKSIVNDEPIRVDHNDAFRALFIADKIEQIALETLN